MTFTSPGFRSPTDALRLSRATTVVVATLAVVIGLVGCPATTPPPQAPPPTPPPARVAPTNTPVPPTATPTAEPATPTPVPPTATPTMVVISPTPTPLLATPTPPPPPVATTTPTPVPRDGAIEVTVKMVTAEGSAPGDDTVAWLPEIGARAEDAISFTVAQRDKTFVPRIAVMPMGSTASFPNYDRVFHNVFSLSAPRTFDLGLYRNGRSEAERFPDPGLVQVYCNIHPEMEASLMVVDARLYGTADSAGRIRIESVPSGTWTLKTWNRRAGFSDHQVTVPSGGVGRVDVSHDVSDWRPAPHLNKHGEEYPPPDDDDFRY